MGSLGPLTKIRLLRTSTSIPLFGGIVRISSTFSTWTELPPEIADGAILERDDGPYPQPASAFGRRYRPSTIQ